MTTIRPLYDPAVNRWFYGSSHAPTIRELLKKLPAGTQVADYYPIGKEAPRTIWPAGNGLIRPHIGGSFHSTTRQSRQAQEQAAKRANVLRAEHEVAAAHPEKKDWARRASRARTPRVYNSLDDIAKVKALRTNGHSYKSIAEVLGSTRGKIAGIWHRLRHG